MAAPSSNVHADNDLGDRATALSGTQVLPAPGGAERARITWRRHAPLRVQLEGEQLPSRSNKSLKRAFFLAAFVALSCPTSRVNGVSCAGRCRYWDEFARDFRINFPLNVNLLDAAL